MLKKSIILTPEIIKTLKLDLIFLLFWLFQKQLEIFKVYWVTYPLDLMLSLNLKKSSAYYHRVNLKLISERWVKFEFFKGVGIQSRYLYNFILCYNNISGVTNCYNYSGRVTYCHEVCLLMWIRNDTEAFTRLWMDRNKLEHNIVCCKTGWFSRFSWPGDFQTFHHSVRVLGLTNINHAPQWPSSERITTLQGSH